MLSEKVVHVIYLLIDSILKPLHLCAIIPTSSRRKQQLDKELHDAAKRSKTFNWIFQVNVIFSYNKCLLNV